MDPNVISTALCFVGGIVLFFFGGMNIGGGEYIKAEPTILNKAFSGVGLLMLLSGGGIQLLLLM